MPTHANRVVSQATLLAASLLAAGCLSSTQRVRIACVPEEMKIYVDGRLLEEGAENVIFLRTDEPHKIFVRGEGYEPQLVVLEPTLDADGRESLGADEVCIEVIPVGMERELDLQMEHDVPGEVPER
jgi:hypothetical protein